MHLVDVRHRDHAEGGAELDLRLLVDHRERLVRHRVELNSTLLWHLHDLWPELRLPGGALFSKKWSTRISRRLARAEQTMRVRITRDELRSAAAEVRVRMQAVDHRVFLEFLLGLLLIEHDTGRNLQSRLDEHEAAEVELRCLIHEVESQTRDVSELLAVRRVMHLEVER